MQRMSTHTPSDMHYFESTNYTVCLYAISNQSLQVNTSWNLSVLTLSPFGPASPSGPLCPWSP